MCGCNNLSDSLSVTAEVHIEREYGLIGTPYIFNPEPITCTASGSGSFFHQDSDVEIIDFGNTIITSYDVFRYAYFTLDMGVDNLGSFEEDGSYDYNITVDATGERIGTCSDSVDVPVDIKYSHGSWTIDSEICPSNVINICNSTNASVDIEFSHSVCGNYDLEGTLDITTANTEILTLGEISRSVSTVGGYSTSESFSVIGCSESLNDAMIDICFDGNEHYLASYSLMSCALAVSNLTDNIDMFDGLGDADNDGINNVNDLDNAGSFVPFLVKTHETATSAQFRFDFDSDNIRIWKKDGAMTRTNSTDSIQAYHNYSYGELFSGSESTFYIQGLEAGSHGISVTYLLDGRELETKSVSVTFVKINLREVSFSGSNNHTIISDDGSLTYSFPHWKDNYPYDGIATNQNERQYPICFTGNSQLNLSCKWYFEPSSLSETIKFKATGSDGYNFSTVTVEPQGNEIVLSNITSTKQLPDAIDYLSELSLNWQMSFDDGQTWYDAGTSKNQMYVTLDDPVDDTPMYHTIVHLGCKNGEGHSNVDSAVEAIWSDFTDLDVKNVNGVVMNYYSNSVPENVPVDIEGLLQNQDGACTAWVDLFCYALKAQGIDDVSVEVCLVKNTFLQNNTDVNSITTNYTFRIIDGSDGGFLVNDWQLFNAQWHPNDTNHNFIDDNIEEDCPNILDYIDPGLDTDYEKYKDGTYMFPYADTLVGYEGITNVVVSGVNLKGQGNIIPSTQKFMNHYIVTRGPVYNLPAQSYIIYDPSYGKKYEGINAIMSWQDASVKGFWQEKTINNTKFIYVGENNSSSIIKVNLIPEENCWRY
jgi:hypothetical protein